MRCFEPDYLSEFHCIKGECRHSCCKGWEIDIDEDTLDFYRRIPGGTGKKLRSCIEETEEGAHFRLDARERCPFLQEDGLCELILRLGEGALCQICTDHPRFRSFFPDRTELGLGLCCEEACRLILTRETPMRITERPGDEEPIRPLSPRQTGLLAFRDRLLVLAQDRTRPMPERLAALYRETGAPKAAHFGDWAAFLLRLERMEAPWGEALEALRRSPETEPRWDAASERMGEQLLCYLLYRHLPRYPVRGAGYALLITELLPRLWEAGGERSEAAFRELCRLYSAELEYSDENVSRVLKRLYRG